MTTPSRVARREHEHAFWNTLRQASSDGQAVISDLTLDLGRDRGLPDTMRCGQEVRILKAES